MAQVSPLVLAQGDDGSLGLLSVTLSLPGFVVNGSTTTPPVVTFYGAKLGTLKP